MSTPDDDLAVLRRCMDDPDGALRAHYQPVLDRQTNSIVALEALARWRSGTPAPTPGSPRFITAVEQDGAGMALTNAMVAQGLPSLAGWHAQGHELTLNVNVFVDDLGHIGETLRAACATYGVPTSAVAVEIKGDATPEQVADTVRRLHHDSIRTEIDHFGADAADLGWLATIPFDGIKIDKWLISGIHRNTRNLTIVRHLVAMANDLGMVVTACGLEHPAEVAAVAETGVHRLQGYGIAGAMTDGIVTDSLDHGLPNTR